VTWGGKGRKRIFDYWVSRPGEIKTKNGGWYEEKIGRKESQEKNAMKGFPKKIIR